MATSLDLQRDAARLADDLSRVLNGTVANGVRLNAVARDSGTRAWIGYKISKRSLAAGEALPLTIDRKPADLFLHVQVALAADRDQQHLMVENSFFGVYCDLAMTTCLFHYDFERHKPDGYPEAHLQVHADSAAWAGVLASRPASADDLASLHLPVGGRRYRPTLEDVVEFLVVEHLVASRDGWREVLNETRNAFHERQLRAAIRMQPHVALDQLRKNGHLPAE